MASTRRNAWSSTPGAAPWSPTPQVEILLSEMPRSISACLIASARASLRVRFAAYSPWPSACPTSCTYEPRLFTSVASWSATWREPEDSIALPVGNRASESSVATQVSLPASTHFSGGSAGVSTGIVGRAHGDDVCCVVGPVSALHAVIPKTTKSVAASSSQDSLWRRCNGLYQSQFSAKLVTISAT